MTHGQFTELKKQFKSLYDKESNVEKRRRMEQLGQQIWNRAKDEIRNRGPYEKYFITQIPQIPLSPELEVLAKDMTDMLNGLFPPTRLSKKFKNDENSLAILASDLREIGVDNLQSSLKAIDFVGEFHHFNLDITEDQKLCLIKKGYQETFVDSQILPQHKWYE